MKTHTLIKEKGFTAAELLIAGFIFMVMFIGAIKVVNTFSRTLVTTNLTSRAQQEVRQVEEKIRLETADNFFQMDETNRDRSLPDGKMKILSTIGPIEQPHLTRR